LAAATWGAYRANLSDPTLTDFLADLNQSPELGELYEYWFAAWQAAGGEMFAHYSDYGLASRYGSWGSLEYLGEQHEAGADTHRYDVLNDLNQQEAWWDDGRDPTAFLHGVTDTGTAGDDILGGTSEEDIFLGGDGDDLIQAGPGNDAVGGGAGINIIEAGDGDDVILLASSADQIDGGNGTDVIRLSSAMASLDLADLAASNVEAVDIRNNAKTTFAVSTADVFAFSATNMLTLLAETADTIELSGFAFKSSIPEGGGALYLYEGQEGTDIVSLEIITDIAQQPDVLLMA
jgi:Ca2+-binding RTX toxin-like protein